MKFDYCAMHSGSVVGDQDLRCRVIRHDDGRAATQREVWEALCDARESLALHEVGSAYAHRLAVMLECALLDPNGTWNDAHALLDEYRAACRAAAPNQEPPTFMGEPVVMPNAKLTGPSAGHGGTDEH